VSSENKTQQSTASCLGGGGGAGSRDALRVNVLHMLVIRLFYKSRTYGTYPGEGRRGVTKKAGQREF